MKNSVEHRVLSMTAIAVMLCSTAAVGTASAEVISITPSKDNSLFEAPPDRSSGQGVTLFSGETGNDGSRRAVLAFDVAGQIPAGSTINSASLSMNVTLAGPFSGNDVYSLHRLTADWGEGASNAGEDGGLGAPAAAGDATWTQRFFGAGQPWTTQGGDFVGASSASTIAPTFGPVSWASSAGTVADVQSWLNNPGGNFGWIVIGNEVTTRTARRLASRESTTPANRPTLNIDYTAPAVQMVSITPSKDNTLYESPPDRSSGQGVTLFCGETGNDGSRRAVVAFDVAGQIPAGSTITAASLAMNVTLSGPFAGNDVHDLHRLTADWGEGASNAGEDGGIGAPAAVGDATWTQRFFGLGQPWTTQGGDFVATPSGSVVAPVLGSFSWNTTPDMVADVQSWLNNPGGNFGWIVIGNETTTRSARRLASSESATPANRPTLTVTYSAGSSDTVGAVPDGDSVPGIPLELDKLGGGLVGLTWGTSCVGSDTDYAVYEGLIGTYYSHVSKICSTGGVTNQSVLPDGSDSYYLVVPTSASKEGSYGTDTVGTQRPAGGSACQAQSIGDPVCP